MISTSSQSGQNAFPQAYCLSCDERTPHRHERLAVRGAQVARTVCLSCNAERGGIPPGKQVVEPR